MPTADLHANRTWMTAALTALNLTALICDLCPVAGASGKAPADAPRTAKTLRVLLFCVPARICQILVADHRRCPSALRVSLREQAPQTLRGRHLAPINSPGRARRRCAVV